MRSKTALLGAIFICTSAAATAQSSVNVSDQEAVSTASQTDWRDNPRLGLLGLLGLAGLLGLMRREPSIHIDAREETPPAER